MSQNAENLVRSTPIQDLVALVMTLTGGSAKEHVIRSQVHRLREGNGRA